MLHQQIFKSCFCHWRFMLDQWEAPVLAGWSWRVQTLWITQSYSQTTSPPVRLSQWAVKYQICQGFWQHRPVSQETVLCQISPVVSYNMRSVCVCALLACVESVCQLLIWIAYGQFSFSSLSENDVQDFRQCVKLSREIFAQKAFDQFRGPEVQPGPQVQSDAEIDAFVRQKADSAYHPSCTCKMGSPLDPMAVVDPNTRVLGLERLRVVDASIMPSMVSGNLNAPTIMVAEKAADIIRGRPSLVDPGVSVYQPATLETQR